MITFGTFFKEKRLALNMTLRKFCQLHHYNSSNISKIERGVLLAPRSLRKLNAYANALNLSKQDRQVFFDLATHARLETVLREEIGKNARFNLPVFLNTTLNAEQLDRLFKLISEG